MTNQNTSSQTSTDDTISRAITIQGDVQMLERMKSAPIFAASRSFAMSVNPWATTPLLHHWLTSHHPYCFER